MKRLHVRLFPIVFTVVLVAGPGCGGDTKPAKPLDKSPLQYFKDEQVGGMMTHGRIMPDSVEESGGRIQYKTEDGKKWSVSYRKLSDGNYKYGPPDEVK